jgi:hypothetical protein
VNAITPPLVHSVIRFLGFSHTRRRHNASFFSPKIYDTALAASAANIQYKNGIRTIFFVNNDISPENCRELDSEGGKIAYFSPFCNGLY